MGLNLYTSVNARLILSHSKNTRKHTRLFLSGMIQAKSAVASEALDPGQQLLHEKIKIYINIDELTLDISRR